MRSLLATVLAAYLIAAIHSILAFINKRRSVQRVAEWATVAGFILHTGTLAVDWMIDGHYPLFFLRETLSFLAWALVAVYALALYRYRAQAVGAFTMPLISVLVFIALLANPGPSDAPAEISELTNASSRPISCFCRSLSVPTTLIASNNPKPASTQTTNRSSTSES